MRWKIELKAKLLPKRERERKLIQKGKFHLHDSRIGFSALKLRPAFSARCRIWSGNNYQNDLTVLLHSEQGKVRAVMLHGLAVGNVDHQDVFGRQRQGLLNQRLVVAAVIAHSFRHLVGQGIIIFVGNCYSVHRWEVYAQLIMIREMLGSWWW